MGTSVCVYHLESQWVDVLPLNQHHFLHIGVVIVFKEFQCGAGLFWNSTPTFRGYWALLFGLFNCRVVTRVKANVTRAWLQLVKVYDQPLTSSCARLLIEDSIHGCRQPLRDTKGSSPGTMELSWLSLGNNRSM